MGTDHIVKNGSASLNNCSFLSSDGNLPKFFSTLMDLLMLGVGVGFDLKGAGAPLIRSSNKKETFVIEDSREGWCQSVAALIESYTNVDYSLPGIEFDYTKIRPAGVPIKGFGGISSGSKPLEDLHNSIRKVLDAAVGEVKFSKPAGLSSLDILDIANLIGKCVVSGNIRRSAELCLGDYNDKPFIYAKYGDNPAINNHRWASNNSIMAEIGMDYSDFADLTGSNGEPGYVWLDNCKAYGRLKDPINYKDNRVAGVNPCSEMTLESFELCCLCELYPANHDTLSEFMDTVKLAYLYGKTVTLVPTHIPETNAVMLRNRRIGTSQTGIINAFNKHGRRTMLEWCDKTYDYIQGLDSQYSSWLCIPKSIKTTTVKPSGSVSLLVGHAPGIHYPHAEYYIRRIRISANSPLVTALRKAGYIIEQIEGQEDTVAACFPVHEENFSRSKNDVSMWEQLENAANYQYYWSDNSVSVTITFKPEEAKDIQYALESYESRLKSVSFLPLVEHGYKHAPYETITKEDYDKLSANLQLINFNTIDKVTDNYCDGDRCII